MNIKQRQTSVKILQLQHLKARSNLDLSDYDSVLLGFYGEQLMDQALDKLDFGDTLVLRDIRILEGKVERQFDTLLIINQCIYILDAKYYLKDTRYEEGKFYHGYQEIEHPDLQIGRSEKFLQQYVWKHFGVNFSVVGHFVFVNKDVTFRNIGRHKRLLKIGDLEGFFHELKIYPVMEVDYDVAKGLAKAHRDKSIYDQDIDLSNVTFKSGLKCPKCGTVHDVEYGTLVRMPCCCQIYKFEDLMYVALIEFCSIHMENRVKVGEFTKFLTGGSGRNYRIARFLRNNLKSTGKRGEYKI
ncbi:nuclease-related domain-containing protein [Macrococcus animalis]|uniref:nuclease-related domain-containing protein n=1 Tax=Macrococcus animalis TaxID=3395467 RepID=UPI0039BE2280